MSTEPDRPTPYVVPRPGVLKALGIVNIVYAVLTMLCTFSMSFYYVMAATYRTPTSEVKVEVQAKKGGSGVPMAAVFNPFFGMNDPHFLRFSLVETGMSLLTNGLLFAVGVGLINLRRWGVRWGVSLAWTRIILNVLFWSYYIVAVAPGFSESMARSVSVMFDQQGITPNRKPPVADLIRVYSIMNLIMAMAIMVFASIYPAITVWLLGRAGVKAAIVDKSVLELEQP